MFLPFSTLSIITWTSNTSFIAGVTILSKRRRNLSDLDSRVFENYILADKLFAKASRKLKADLSVNKNLCGKLSHH